MEFYSRTKQLYDLGISNRATNDESMMKNRSMMKENESTGMISRVKIPKRITLKKYVARSPEMIWYQGLLIETSAT